MTLDPHTLGIILAMTAAALFCRYAGFAFMRFVPLTPRVRAGLGTIPLAVLLALVLPAALRGGVAELLAIAATAALVLLRFNELVGILVGMAVVAVARTAGL